MLSGENIRRIRKINGLTQRQVAEYVGVSVRFIKLVEHDDRKFSEEKYKLAMKAMYTLQPNDRRKKK